LRYRWGQVTRRLAILCASFAGTCGLVSCGETPPDDSALEQPANVKVCATGPVVHGIDVSRWDGTVDWAKVKAAGIDFAFIRVSDGITVIDEQFPANWAGARAAGVIRGAYQFFRANDDPVALADAFLDHMGPLEDDDLPPVADVEGSDGETQATVAAHIGAWIDRVEQATGRHPIIYAGLYSWPDYVNSSAYVSYPLWIPQYGPTCPTLPPPWTSWAFFQYSSTGSVSGVGSNCDLDVFNGDMTALHAFIASSVIAKRPPPPPPPAPVRGVAPPASAVSYDTCAASPEDCLTEVKGGCDVGGAGGAAPMAIAIALLGLRRRRGR